VGRATSVSADTDILVVPALVRSDRGKHVERCQKGELPDQQNFWREMKKISSLEVAYGRGVALVRCLLLWRHC